MAYPKDNFSIITPSTMNLFPYLLLGNVYFAKATTVGLLIGESAVICADIEGKEDGQPVEFLPFHSGEIKLFSAVRGIARALHQGLMLVMLTEPIGRTLSLLLKDEANEDLLAIEANGLFAFMSQQVEKVEEMTEMRCNGFLEDNLAIVGYFDNFDFTLLKKSLSNRFSTMSNAITLTSTFGQKYDAIKRYSSTYMFQPPLSKQDGNSSGDEGFSLFEARARLISTENELDIVYKVEDVYCQRGTPLFLKMTNNKRIEYILLGFHSHNELNTQEDISNLFTLSTRSTFSPLLRKDKASLNKGVLYSKELYDAILHLLNPKLIISIPQRSSISLTKSIMPSSSTYYFVNYYFFNHITSKGIISKHCSLSALFKSLTDQYNIPQEHLQFSLGDPNALVSFTKLSQFDLAESIIDKLSSEMHQEEAIEVNIFASVNMTSFGLHLSHNITQRLKDIKVDQRTHTKLLMKSVLKEIRRYQALSSHFYGLLFNDLKDVFIHKAKAE